MKKSYKLFRELKSGEITSLFINKTRRLPLCEWMDAEEYETKGFAFRPGWHCTSQPHAPHLTTKGRVWMEVVMDGYEEIKRPESQGGLWYLAKRMMIIPGKLTELKINQLLCST
jgi:hypothetical protein